jgi:hypothetical protein
MRCRRVSGAGDAVGKCNMDWIATLSLIKEKLQMTGYDQTGNRIIEAQMILGTPGEMYIEVMNELLDLKRRSPREYEIVEIEVEQLLDYGKSLKYFNPT